MIDPDGPGGHPVVEVIISSFFTMINLVERLFRVGMVGGSIPSWFRSNIKNIILLLSLLTLTIFKSTRARLVGPVSV